MAKLMRQAPVNSAGQVEPVQQPQPIRRPMSHGAMLENQQMEQYEKELGIDAVN